MRAYRNRLRDYEAHQKAEDAEVPCGDCNVCCRSGYAIGWSPTDDPSLRWEVSADGYRVLEDNEGACVYLQEGTCTVYDRRPLVCRSYDCRLVAMCGAQTRNNPALNAAINAWDKRRFLKTYDDRVALAFIRQELVARIGGSEGVEQECGDAVLVAAERMKFGG